MPHEHGKLEIQGILFCLGSHHSLQIVIKIDMYNPLFPHRVQYARLYIDIDIYS